MARQKKKAEGGVSQGWLMTFSDMITLLLCFFVLLNMMSTLDVEKFKQLMMNLRGSPDIFNAIDNTHKIGSTGLQTAPDIPPDFFTDPTDEWLMAAYRMMGEIDKWKDGQQDPNTGQGGQPNLTIKLEVSEATIIIRIDGEVLFDTLSDTLLPGGIETLDFIMETLIMPEWETGLIGDIFVEGHADERPIPSGSGIFRNNLVLSTFRAIAVHQYVMPKYNIPPNRIAPSGWGDTRPLARDPGETVEEWWEKNRRVEFVLNRDYFHLNEETGEGYEEAS